MVWRRVCLTQTILAVLRFFGFTDTTVSFFKKFLEAPLKFTRQNFRNGKGARIRRRGMPMAHAPEKLIGELVLFILDVCSESARRYASLPPAPMTSGSLASLSIALVPGRLSNIWLGFWA
ncbi:unnamed protein product [Clonostachys rosea f. rosea IK726]|uniref:Uncharacterized protein n=1 Tax=Clonostachys rosea f. rosea IK726 TaxID=1349383 RepID=A0ACA9U9Q9_BIOOC|nr:unnamed protein product [Clonostachys rosea f. rosea IK726]